MNLGLSGPIDSLVHELASQCNSPSDLDEASFQVTSVELYQRLFGEVVGQIGAAQKLFISADGPLHNLSFGTLVDQNHDYLIDHLAVHYLNTSRDLVFARENDHEPGNGWLIVADPILTQRCGRPPTVSHLRRIKSISALHWHQHFPLTGAAFLARPTKSQRL
ncbi:MAG: CHAT domain-containing protein [bacterium]|nr:CHAT domain-containing protein [bacterium]